MITLRPFRGFRANAPTSEVRRSAHQGCDFAVVGGEGWLSDIASATKKLSPGTSIVAICPNRVRRHFHLQPICNVMRIKTDRCSHTEEGNVIILHLFIERRRAILNRSASSSTLRAFCLERNCSARVMGYSYSRPTSKSGRPNLAEISVHGQPIVICHYAMRVWNRSHHGAWHLYGHSHGNLPDTPTSRRYT